MKLNGGSSFDILIQNPLAFVWNAVSDCPLFAAEMLRMINASGGKLSLALYSDGVTHQLHGLVSGHGQHSSFIKTDAVLTYFNGVSYF